MAKCQDKTIEEQYKAGARLFDVRVVFDKNGIPLPCHGMMKFKGNLYDVFEQMNNFDHPVYCRILNERNENFEEFIKFCIIIKLKYRNITFFGGNNKKDWKVLFEFDTKVPYYIDKYSSWNEDTSIGTGWHLDDIWPRIYAFCFNKYWRKKYKDKDGYLLQDFIGVY